MCKGGGGAGAGAGAGGSVLNCFIYSFVVLQPHVQCHKHIKGGTLLYPLVITSHTSTLMIPGFVRVRESHGKLEYQGKRYLSLESQG